MDGYQTPIMTFDKLLSTCVDALLAALSGLLVPALVFALVSVLFKKREVLAAFRRSLPSSFTNLGLIALNAFIVTPVVVLLANALMAWQVGAWAAGLWDALPAPIVMVLAVFLGDFIGYWRHRFEHSRLLWPSHAIHHSDEHMTWLTLERFHPINRLSTYVIDTGFLLLLGLPPYALIFNNLVRHFYGYFIHADIPLTFGRWGRVFVSPAMHRWHHANHPDAYHTNFATVFSVFDQCFGTHRVPGVCDIPLGVSDKSLSENIASQIAYPLRVRPYRA